MIDLPYGGTSELVYNWDGRLRHRQRRSVSVSLRYDPAGNRVWKQLNDYGLITNHKYIVDVVGDLPVILLEIDTSGQTIEKTYIYANSQIIAQHDGSPATNNKYFYLHDRLGSVREIIDTNGDVVNTYTYDSFGREFSMECEETITNPFRFTGQWYDLNVGQYYLRARMYDQRIGRFTSRDPVPGEFEHPLTLHKYLYCGNNPINYIDADGRIAIVIGGSFSGNITAADLGSAFVGGIKGLRGIGAMAAYYGAILPGMTMAVEHFGFGGTAGAGFVAAWDHTRGLKGLTDRSAWSWGTMQWGAGGGSVATGSGGSLTADFGISLNARRVGDLAGGFTEYGGSITGPAPVGSPFFFGTGGFTYAVGDNGVELWTVSGGAAYSSWGWGFEGHRYRGHAWVQEYEW